MSDYFVRREDPALTAARHVEARCGRCGDRLAAEPGETAFLLRLVALVPSDRPGTAVLVDTGHPLSLAAGLCTGCAGECLVWAFGRAVSGAVRPVEPLTARVAG